MNESNAKPAPLDLSKLAPRELPVEPFEVRLKGDFKVDKKTGEKIQNVQVIPIHPLSGSGLIAWGNNPKNNPDGVTFEERAVLTALIYGADMPENQAKLLMDYDHESAVAISQAVWVATARFRKEQKREEEEAEKNSETAEVNTGD